VFDPSKKKKKKKKKTKEEDKVADEKPAVEEEVDAPAAVEQPDEASEDPFDPPTKKKKKKKKAAAENPEEEEEDDGTFGTFDLSKMPKKKKRPKMDADAEFEAAIAAAQAVAASKNPAQKDGAEEEGEESSAAQEEEEEEEQGPPVQDAPVWHGSDRAYTYDELLCRIFGMLNPDISSKKAFKMKPPVVVREGTKRVVLVNFQEIVLSMNRLPEHLLSFMLAELGTSGSLDGQGRVTFKYAGRQAQKHMESVIKQYVKEYVLCKLCKSSDTKLNKDSATRLYFMVCGSCGASRSVNPIKSGFQAQIGKRKKKF